MKKSFALYSNNIQSEFVTQIKQHFLGDNKDYSDFVVITDSNGYIDNHTAKLPSFYLKFYRGAIIFDNINDYLENKDRVLSKDLYLLSTIDDIIKNNIDKNTLKNTQLITINYENSNETI